VLIMLPTVAIIGRPNVGKSTLFNRLIRADKALTHDLPGVTRDRIVGQVRWTTPPFMLVDTGGLVLDAEEVLEAQTVDQAREAIDQAHLVLFMVDARQGLTSMDLEVADLLRKSDKPVVLVVNKVDGQEQEAVLGHEFHALGFDLVCVSAAHGYNVHALVDLVQDRLPEIEQPEEKIEEGLKLAVLGKPNAGKSSIINKILGQNRLIVSSVPGTTRDSVDVVLEAKGKRYTFIDTAGVRRKSKVGDKGLERFSVLRALTSARRADVVVLVLDATQGVVAQDKKLLAYLVREKISFLVAVNKTDLVPGKDRAEMKKAVEYELRICRYAPVIYTSAETGQGLGRILPLAEKIQAQARVRIGTGELNRALREALEGYQAPAVKGRRPKIYYLTQTGTNPPTFVFFVNDPARIKESYSRYLENRLRKLFGLDVSPIRVFFRASRDTR